MTVGRTILLGERQNPRLATLDQLFYGRRASTEGAVCGNSSSFAFSRRARRTSSSSSCSLSLGSRHLARSNGLLGGPFGLLRAMEIP
jgi:hypothetical protein